MQTHLEASLQPEQVGGGGEGGGDQAALAPCPTVWRCQRLWTRFSDFHVACGKL